MKVKSDTFGKFTSFVKIISSENVYGKNYLYLSFRYISDAYIYICVCVFKNVLGVSLNKYYDPVDIFVKLTAGSFIGTVSAVWDSVTAVSGVDTFPTVTAELTLRTESWQDRN